MDKMEVGARLRQLRDVRGLSQDELGQRIHGGQQKISKLERGISNLTYEDLMRLAQALHFDIGVFSHSGPEGWDLKACLKPLPGKEGLVGKAAGQREG